MEGGGEGRELPYRRPVARVCALRRQRNKIYFLPQAVFRLESFRHAEFPRNVKPRSVGELYGFKGVDRQSC